MFKLNSFLYNLKYVRYKPMLVRLAATHSIENASTLSQRERSYELSRKIYENFQHVFYSSYLELNSSYKLRSNSHNKVNNNLNERFHKKETQQCGPQAPTNWMDDYEYYSGGNEESREHNGTADPSIPHSNIPCNGCGALLHCNHFKRPGFLPTEIFKGRTENELKTIICQRCHFLKYYNQALDVEVTSEFYIQTISTVKDKFALAIVVVDLLDFPCSIWPDMHALLGPKRPVFIVGNKVDLLPRDSNSYLDHIKECLKSEILKSGFSGLNVKHISLISAKTGYGIESLITQLHNIWAHKGDVYLMGCTNVGKSSLFNILLNSDYCRPETVDLIRKATTCPWPGTTLQMLKFPIHRPSEFRIYQRFKRLKSERFIRSEEEKLRLEGARKMGNTSYAVPIGTVGRTIYNNTDDVNDVFAVSQGTNPITTFNERSKVYQQARWVYDTPGVMHPEQITNLLTPEELNVLQPEEMIAPRCYRLKPGMSLFVAGLSRLDYIQSDSNDLNWIKVFLFASFELPTMIVDTVHAADIYEKYLNTALMKIPMGNEERFQNWPGLQRNEEDFIVKGYILKSKCKDSNCSGDIVLSSSGWIGMQIPEGVHCVFRAWTPNARGIYLRTPSLVPYADRLIGKRVPNSLAYYTSKPFVFKK